jgi:hypothetical protein
MNMHRLRLLCGLLVLWMSSGMTPARADVVIQQASGATGLEGQPSGFGAGLTVGTILGLAGSWRPDVDSRWWTQAELGASAVNGGFHMAGDYLITIQQITTNADADFRLDLAAGGGLRVQSDQDNMLGVRVPVGVTLVPNSIRIDGFVQLVPTLVLLPAPAVRLDANMGARFYF